MMQDYESRIEDLSLKGYGCSQILIQLGLDEQKKENQDLVNALKGLCVGLCSGKLCGALSGGACLLSFYKPEKACEEMVPQLVKWFEMYYGTVNCKELLGDDPMAKMEKCPVIVTETYEKVLELLEEY